MTNLERYLLSMNLLHTLHKQGIISAADFTHAEQLFADKNCIKKGSIYRKNDLINSRFRAIYMLPKKQEVRNGNSNKS